MQACHSLSEAKSHDRVHRDINPANIFLCRYGEDCDFVKVLDFGLVKAFGESAGDHQHHREPALTRENLVQGTPAFIALEQALGEPVLDARVDISTSTHRRGRRRRSPLRPFRPSSTP
ncbi:MAG TPA: hypothetical protein VFT28_02660 [Gemmatimonadales bacterium]|nr:hypothetical protein [Gemmatimonadales bacterium]